MTLRNPRNLRTTHPRNPHTNHPRNLYTGIVLCGGRSTRMGDDKASLPFGRETMLERAVRIVGTAVDEVIVVARPDQAISSGWDASANSGLRIVRDGVEGRGPLAGIAAGLHASHTDLNFITACDMPLLNPAVIRRVLEMIDGFEACVPVRGEHVMTLCAAYRKSLAATADALLDAGQLRVTGLVDRAEAKRVDAETFRDIDPDLESFFSCDTPERYAEALGRWSAEV